MKDKRGLDESTRRRIRWTVIALAVLALVFYISAIVRQMG
jgi:hypothetical protein